jgi:uncharacterized membrane protein YebE (DUF533 family)
LAIDVDTDAERTYMRALAQRLGLTESILDEIHGQLGIERPSFLDNRGVGEFS